jgi:hypothetical protein
VIELLGPTIGSEYEAAKKVENLLLGLWPDLKKNEDIVKLFPFNINNSNYMI